MPTILLIACGAIARELTELQRCNNWAHIRIQCLPASLHNAPEEIPAAVRAAIVKYREQYEQIFVAYADCGTGGLLDTVLDEYGINRLPGAHCYEFYSGSAVFNELGNAEPGTFYLTDFLVRHFDRLIKQGSGLLEHPQLMQVYFHNYRRVLYLAQGKSDKLSQLTRNHAEYLGLDYCELAHVSSAGNAAGTGARIALLDKNARPSIERRVRQIEKIETALEARFQHHFVSAMPIPHQTDPFTELRKLVELPAARKSTRRRRSR